MTTFWRINTPFFSKPNIQGEPPNQEYQFWFPEPYQIYNQSPGYSSQNQNLSSTPNQTVVTELP